MHFFASKVGRVVFWAAALGRPARCALLTVPRGGVGHVTVRRW